MAHLLRMPAVAANAEDALLAHWLTKPGASFTPGESLAVVETEKAAVEIEAESAGVLVRALVADGATVEVGSPIALLAEVGETLSDIESVLAELGVSTSANGGGAAATASSSASPAASATPTSEAIASATPAAGDHARLFASPLARRLAREAGIAVESITGTGPNGRIVRRDVESAIAGGASAAPVSVSPVPPVAIAAQASVVPHSRMRRAIASRLQQSKQTAPHFYVKGTCRVDALLAAREVLNQHTDVKVSINDFVIKAIAKAHQRVPEMNVIWTDDAIHTFSSVDLSVAIALDSGLVTPVIRGVESLGLSDIARAVRSYADRARTGQLLPTDLEGGTVTVTNLGMYGVEEFAAIINPPQSSILAVGAVTREVVVADDDSTQIASVMRVVLSSDHRPIDGVVAARWMKAFVDIIENPVLLSA